MLLLELESIDRWTEQGRTAFFKKQTKAENPYTPNSKAWIHWNRGWNLAQGKAGQMKWQDPGAVNIPDDTGNFTHYYV